MKNRANKGEGLFLRSLLLAACYFFVLFLAFTAIGISINPPAFFYGNKFPKIALKRIEESYAEKNQIPISVLFPGEWDHFCGLYPYYGDEVIRKKLKRLGLSEDNFNLPPPKEDYWWWLFINNPGEIIHYFRLGEDEQILSNAFPANSCKNKSKELAINTHRKRNIFRFINGGRNGPNQP